MKQILRYTTHTALLLVATVFIATSCDDKNYEWDGFATNNDDSDTNYIKIAAANEGTTPISIYATGKWSAEIENDIDWGELTESAGDGWGHLTFKYAKNTDAERRAYIVVHQGSQTKRILVKQEGDPIQFRFRAADGEMSIEKDATTYQFALDANISSDLYKYVVVDKVTYEPEEQADWLSNIAIRNKQLAVEVAANDSGAERKAHLTITFTDPYTQAVYGPSSITLSQSTTSSVEITWDTLMARYAAAADKDADGNWVIATEGEEESVGIKISGINLSFAGNKNAAQNVQSKWVGSSFQATNTENNDASTYFMSEDGRYSMYVRMQSGSDNVLAQYTRAQLRVDGLTMCLFGNNRYALLNVPSRNIVSTISATTEPQPTERKITELTDADYYKIVTIKNVELVYNRGALYNTTDGYRNCNDFYPTMLRDADGNTIYMVLNYASAVWSRNGKAAPQGAGDVTGIVVYEKSARFGRNGSTAVDGGAAAVASGDLGHYVLRPFNSQCIRIADSADDGFSTTLVEWNWDNEKLEYDTDNAIAPFVGEGTMRHQAGVTPVLGNNFNGLTYGTAAAGTQIAHRACAFSSAPWMDENGKFIGVELKFPTTAAHGAMSLSLAYWGGDQGPSGSGLTTPSNWHVEYSTNGTDFAAVEDSEFDVHPFVWWSNTCPTFAIHGLMQASCVLPAELAGLQTAYLRILPYTARCASLSDAEGGQFSQDITGRMTFANVTVKYNK